MNVRQEFEDEIARRGLVFSVEQESGQHVVMIGGGRMLINLDNLEREVAPIHLQQASSAKLMSKIWYQLL